LNPTYPLIILAMLYRANRFKKTLAIAIKLRASLEGNQGLTLIECLVAILMVALLASAIAPALVVAVATRVQSQKSDQALKLAQSEIDRVRLAVEQGLDSQTNAEFFPPRVSTLADNAVQGYGPPSATVVASRSVLDNGTKTLGIKLNPPEAGNVVSQNCVQDNSCDFAVQIYRAQGLTRDPDVTFAMGVRVYDYNAVISNSANLDTEALSLAMTGGQGKRTERPLAALYTTIARGEDRASLCDLFNYTGANSSVTGETPDYCSN
jgi:prepilin-type N-terminal cleavage/methylation domain-containing protein